MTNYSNLRVFEGLDEDIINEVINNSQTARCGKGTVIMKEGDFCNGEAYIIEEGTVEVLIDGKRVASLGEGDIFGEIALIMEGESRAATIRSTSEILVVRVIDEDVLKELLTSEGSTLNDTAFERIKKNIENALI